MALEAAGWYFETAHHQLSEQTLAELLARAERAGLRGAIDAMFAGEHVNVTEDRAVLHVALRMPASATLVVDGVDVVRDVHRVLEKMRTFSEHARRFRNVVNIGIGGSDLGPSMAYDALWAYTDPDRQFRFVSNIDGADLAHALHDLEPAETLFIVSSKSFTTLETLTNACSARSWVVDALGEEAVADHFVAVSTNRDAVIAFGCDPDNMFEFWDWVGGRYSMWSAIGLSLMCAIGADHFDELLAGAHAMDEHFRSAPFDSNIPALMGLLTAYYREERDAETQVVVPYAQVLGKLPSYLQQLEMESNGKRVHRDGSPVSGPTGEVVWGTAGTNGQHAYFQLLHQGTLVAPIDFIGFARPQPGLDVAGHQDLLVSNMIAQSEALAFGTNDPSLPPYRVMPGGRPSSVFLADQLTPYALGALVAAYEHKVMTLGVLWDIDSFDQWGVELGKQLARQVAAEMQSDSEPVLDHDAATNALISRYRARRGPA